MATGTVTVTLNPRPGAQLLVAPGLSTPHALCTGVRIEGADWAPTVEDSTGQPAYVATSGEAPITIRYSYASGGSAYPEAMFAERPSRFTRAAEGLMQDAQAYKTAKDPATAIARHVAELFIYGHPDTRYYDDQDQIPQLCALTEGSCVDINFYFMASLRAVGIKTGYVVGPFFPEEKTSEDGSAWCNDMHCWVVTQDAHGTREWDIAHHLKLGTREIKAALDPKPGKRFAVAHSMGLSFQDLGLQDIKLASEPMWLAGEGRLDRSDPKITCEMA